MKTNFNVQNTLSDQMLKNTQFEYGQKESFGGKKMGYTDRGAVKKFSNSVNDSYLPKNQPAMYQGETTPNYQLFPVKEMSNQRNSRPPVNWMTDPDVRSRSMNYGAAKIPPYTQPDIFYMNNQKPQSDISTDCVLTDVNKVNYQKNDFYPNKNMDVQMKVPDQRCKNVEKRSDAKFPAKVPLQNSYNIFDYNYNGNYFSEEEGNKFCDVQNFQSNVKNKKSNSTPMTKKKDPVQLINPEQNETGKRNSDQIISNLDFNPVGNQECFSWVPGKNVEWLPSKSFVDTNLILPSTLPTLVGDLALGTTTSNETPKSGNRTNQTKSSLEATGKTYIDIGFGSNTSFPKDPAADGNKQYLEPFTNLSKNIFDVTPSNNMQNPQLPKNDCDKNGYLGNTNETIVLKNIFELPVSKSFNDFTNRNKQRPVNNTQNTFLSVSQLVETPNYDSSIKNEGAMENNVAKPAEYPQNFNAYHGSQKSYKNKTRNYKYNDRKYHTYKNASSNYTAEALIRSNANLPYQGNDFQPEVNANFYTGKTTQKTDTFPANEAKSDFVPCSTQNIYTDFNFSSPVPNFNISTSVSADYVTHDNNFSAQNNTFFGDFIPPEYPITESVSNSLLLPPCSIGLQNPFIIEKRNGTPEKSKTQGKHYSNSRSRKNFDCSKTNYSDFSIHNTSSGIFTNASITCPTIFTTTSCQNLLPVPNQNIPDPNITFSASSFTTSNITFPPLTSNANANYHRPGTGTNNAATTTFFPSSCHSMLTTCSTTTVSSSRTCQSTVPPTSSSSAVITTPFSVGNAFPPSTQSIPFLSLSNPIIPPSVPTTSGNTLANFNLSTIFPEINQKGNYHYP
ncbi:UNVERIFIED_CONTAM: hypothetical protein PYX00_010139 [Menopon gallinae]|uniref:Uncharacterized protein n=1 Tax=Menopon gallinae TaxID=328185 RepID=A0AAW2HE23_9NEOP